MFDEDELEKIKKSKEKWEEENLEPTLNKFGERKEEFKTGSGKKVKRIYEPNDIKDTDYVEDINWPGRHPFTRGVYSTMHRGRIWTMRLYSGFGTAEETNERWKYLIEQGQSGLSAAFDLPTQIGLDSDHPLAVGEVGKVGVAIDSLRDMERLFDDIKLDQVSTSMTINAPTPVLLGMYVALAQKQGVDPKDLRGTVQNDILKEYVARNTFIFPPEPSMKLVGDVIEYCSENLPRWNSISISGYHFREAGSTATQELAFTIANGIEYVESALERGLDVDDFAPRLSFFFGAHSDLMEEIAKFRAARRLWAKIMKERFGAEDPNSCKLRFHVQTAGCTLTAQQPKNNIVRTAFEALAGVLGGAQSIHTNSYDEALALPSEEAVSTALRTQQILAHETGVTNTMDPLGGSYYIETLTNELEEDAREYIKKIEKIGGVPKAIEQGYIQQEIQDSAYEYQREIDEGERTIVGVNKFTEEEEEIDIELHKVDPEVAETQIQRLEKVKKERDTDKVESALEELRKTAEAGDNVMNPIIKAVEQYATIGEICDVLRDVYGEYEESSAIAMAST
ncbi:methylmalonyl-CoA mutase [candidate division MSBL1 archaeon SCGC-AAA259I14]|uniref:Methylmalonyl-CoA mutase n=2 Tax=candidate division MSBL1 TaxID=215777 RepID=A0A133UTS3_9EURY|nr:methylmalonyl-CoA mutase [candidate division MSBL1 archaeon SCGC-AAA259E22]KXA97618.1 methylmalonyl-CoA mutase [candidate division MSBL1 archaeon SCGC-AAA259I14]